MAALTDEAKMFVVRRLAEYARPTDIVHEVKAEFGIDTTRQQISGYDPRIRQKKPVAEKWRVLFEKTRKAFREDTSDIPIAQRAYRLRKLDDLAATAIKRGNAPLAASLMEQAAKESGDVFTNRVNLNHSGKVATDPGERTARIEALLSKLVAPPEKVKAE